MDRRWICEGLLEALELADRELRGRHARKFQKVDRIKRQPDWCPWWDRPSGGALVRNHFLG